MTRRNELHRKALANLQESEVLMLDGHFDYGNGYHGRLYLNAHQIFRQPSLIWRFAQDLIEILPDTVLQATEVVAGPVMGGALLAHTIAGLLDGRRSLTHPLTSFAPLSLDSNGNLILRPFYRSVVAGKRVLGRIAIMPDDGELAAAIGRGLRGLAGETRAGPDLLRHRLTEILVQLAERGVVFGGARAASLAERVGAHVGRDLTHAWTAGEVAKALALGETTLRRHLAAEGTSFTDILAGARLGYALLLLQSSERSVVQIAQDVGYQSPSRFAARFRARFGVPPSELR